MHLLAHCLTKGVVLGANNYFDSLFKSNDGTLINADLNGSYQIIRKVFPNAFMQWDRGCGLHPIRISF